MFKVILYHPGQYGVSSRFNVCVDSQRIQKKQISLGYSAE
jgi:hypothetical protein